ncbi:LacI family DNA-binding transcriptional regulator [Microlunatus antarcticus]|uniref:LacI family transcriptional regulator n=1 Tax=Microlunatus antarcticus TaxID=53388 RepID=A0A7W5JXC9_9ACTN|nr:LacI family transcriptional regulator [Microlunatus antarcticus]
MPTPPDPVRRATAAEVARLAGVSPAVVSYVLNEGPRPVAPATAERVRDAVRQLDYRPNRAARALRVGSTGMVGLILPSVSNPFFAAFSEAFQAAAHQQGLAVIAASSDAVLAQEQELVESLPRHGIDGLVVATVMHLADSPALSDPGLPTVVVNAPFPVPGVHALGPDTRQGARLAVEHLLTVHGHRSVALVSGETAAERPTSRELGWSQAVSACNADTGPIVRVPFDRLGGLDAAQQLLALPERPTAVFATSDAQAFGLLHGLWSAGVRVPGDVAVVGFDGTDDGAYAVPPLTSARQPVAAMAAAALDALHLPPGSSHELFALDLVVRESCGCRPA